MDGKVPTLLIKHQALGEAEAFSEETINCWMERLQELTAGCTSENISNVDEPGVFQRLFLTKYYQKTVTSKR